MKQHISVIFAGAFVALAFLGDQARAGYEQPCFIDGCQSANGRFVITAEPVGKIANHGPNQWNFVWKDTQTKETRTFPAKGVSKGQVFGQLYIAPDGETFALFNHVTLWYDGKSDMHGATKLWGDKPGYPKDIKHEAFSRRIIVYKKDGTMQDRINLNLIGIFARSSRTTVSCATGPTTTCARRSYGSTTRRTRTLR